MKLKGVPEDSILNRLYNNTPYKPLFGPDPTPDDLFERCPGGYEILKDIMIKASKLYEPPKQETPDIFDRDWE